MTLTCSCHILFYEGSYNVYHLLQELYTLYKLYTMYIVQSL